MKKDLIVLIITLLVISGCNSGGVDVRSIVPPQSETDLDQVTLILADNLNLDNPDEVEEDTNLSEEDLRLSEKNIKLSESEEAIEPKEKSFTQSIASAEITDPCESPEWTQNLQEILKSPYTKGDHSRLKSGKKAVNQSDLVRSDCD